MRIDHAGVATDDVDSLADRYERLFGSEIVHEERFDGMDVVFLALENGYFELIEPVGDGPIARYLDSHGGGLHHLAFETDDIQAALEAAADLGVERIDEKPRPGAWGHDVAFLHPKSTGGALIEFVQH